MESQKNGRARRSRGVILTEEALSLVDQALVKIWEKSEARLASRAKRISSPRKLSREQKAEMLGVNLKTVDKLYHREALDKPTLKDIFDKLHITPPFSPELHCASAPPRHAATPCIGRDTQIAEIKTLLYAGSLVTLTGPGGIGKTRLATQVAEEVKDDYSAGVWSVELAGVAEPSLVVPAVAQALGVHDNGERPLLTGLTYFLREKRLLLLLDNCEHLAGACATLLDTLLSSSATLRVLATSRERLNIPFEKRYPVPPLSVPELEKLPAGSDAVEVALGCNSVRLFVERARILRPEFTVTNRNAARLASICSRLDGIPLALELAAGRMGDLSLGDLEHGLNDCFRVLVGGNSALPRHQTLRATMDWSFHLLNEQEQAVLCRLSVFADGCSLDTAEQVCSGGGVEPRDVRELLCGLVGSSLVGSRARGEQQRYQLLETVRQYAREKLTESGERESAHRRHRDYFLALAEEIDPLLKTNGKDQALERLEAEIENFRIALAYCLDESGASGLRLCGALLKFWGGNGHLTEGASWCAQALMQPGAQERDFTRAKVLNGAGILVCLLGDYRLAREYHTESQGIHTDLENPLGAASSLVSMSGAAFAQGDLDFTRSCSEQCLAIYRQLGDLARAAGALRNLADLAHAQGDDASATTLLNESLSLSWQTKDRLGLGSSLYGLGMIAYYRGDYPTAKICLDASLNHFLDLAARSCAARALRCLGQVAQALKDYPTACSYYDESLALFDALECKGDIASWLESLARFAARDRRSEMAATLWGAAEALREEIRTPILAFELKAYQHSVAEARQAMGEVAFIVAWTHGRSLGQEEAIAYALAGLQ